MINFKKITCLLLCVLVLLTSCSLFDDDGSGRVFKISLSDDPINLDPQIANDKNSIAVCENIFSRLVRTDPDGTVSAWAAEDYEISDDGLTYTFYLNRDFQWQAAGGYTAPVTAYDFVFAFERLFDPQNRSPYSNDYFCIKNSRAVFDGEISYDQLGVVARDDYTLVFTLEYENAGFLYLLSLLPASPCNSDFFESCKGKYGLEADCIASNGPFYVRYWQHDQYSSDNYLKLRRNDSYNAVSRVYPSGVTFLVNRSKETRLKNFYDETTDILVLDDFTSLAVPDNYSTVTAYDKTACIVFNLDNEIFANAEVRQIFSWAINRDLLVSNEFLVPAYSLYPSAVNVVGTTLSDADSSYFVYDKAMSEYKWNYLLTDDQKSSLNGLTLLLPDTFSAYDLLKSVTDSWYKLLGVHIAIEVVNENDYFDRIEKGDYDTALVVLESDSGNALDYILDFGTATTFGFTLNEVIDAENSLNNTSTLSSYIRSCSSAQDALLGGYYVLPVWYVATRCYYTDNASDFTLNPFTNAVMFEKAKYF